MIKNPNYGHARPGDLGVYFTSSKLPLRIPALLSFLVFFLWAGLLQAQEICNNGIDDDNDGYIDCFDSDCSTFPCDSTFFGGPIPNCQVVPTIPAFQMQIGWETDSVNYPMDNRQTVNVGDMDGDGIPEVVAKDAYLSNALYFFDGVTGAHKQTINTPPMDVFLDATCIGDVDLDGFGEVFVVADGNLSTRLLYCYEHTGALKWASNVPVGYTVNDDRWTPHLADFNEDGVPEVYLGNQVFNSLTGVQIAAGGATGSIGAFPNNNEPFPVAVDVLPSGSCANCAGLELVCGNTVYSVNVATNTINPELTFVGLGDGPTSIADIDLDGDLDAVVVTNFNGRGVVYAWDLQTGNQIGTTFQIDLAVNAGSNITNAGGQANIADFNGDGTPEIGLAGNNVYVVIDLAGGALTELWSKVVVDASQRTGSTVFDFEGDGANEVVYRDENALYVINGTTGATIVSFPCPAGTRFDFPVVADVDADGQTEIVCTCDKNIKTFEAVGNPWITARKVFNQHSYFGVNVNDDLTIPTIIQEHHRGYPSNAPVRYPLNSFLTQHPTYDFEGNPRYEAADDSAAIVDPVAHMDYTMCLDTINNLIGVAPTIFNIGDQILPLGTSVSLYNGNPFFPGAALLSTVTTPANIAPGNNLLLPMTFIPDQGGMFTLFVQSNDDGSGAIPISAPASGHYECNYLNNLDSLIILACGNTPPQVDTSGMATDTVLVTMLEDTQINICITATDAQNHAYHIAGIVGTPALGTAGGFADGDSCFTYAGGLNANGMDTLHIIICDYGPIPLCDTFVVIVTILPLNDPPRAYLDIVSTNEDTPIMIFAQGNDVDVDGDPLTTTIYINAQNGTGIVSGDSILYTPNMDFVGRDTIFYIICDNGTPPLCDTSVIYITVLEVNDPPIAVNDTFMAPNALTNQHLPLLLNDYDLENDSLVWSILTGPSHGTVIISGDSLLYTPDSSYLGFDTIVYVLCDTAIPPLCDTATIFIEVTNANVPPMALNDSIISFSNTSVIFDVLSNDFDANGQNLIISAIVCGPSNGMVMIVNDSLVYTALPGYVGPDTICYVACDVPPAGQPLCDTAMVFITVLSDNLAPIAIDDDIFAPAAVPTIIDVLANDLDPNGDSLNVTILVPPVHGTLIDNGDGTWSFNPDGNYAGQDSFQYELCDQPAAGLPLCDTAWVRIEIGGDGIVIANGFSPNGDGANDVLIVDGLTPFPDHTLTIFNRWGSTVYETQNYANDWGGTHDGQRVPDGTYYWVVDPGDGTPPLSGYFIIFQ